MKQYSLKEVAQMSFEQVGAIEDPLALGATGFVSPMVVRYVVRTGQLETRYPGNSLPSLLDAINIAAAAIGWPEIVGQKLPGAERDKSVETYLDELQPHVNRALAALGST